MTIIQGVIHKLIRQTIIQLAIILIVISGGCCFGQAGVIEGHVFTEDRKSHISYANVFLANTLIGTTTDSTGAFRLNNVPRGKYSLIVSFVGYERVSIDIQVESVNNRIEVLLRQKVTNLDAVEVKWDNKEYLKQLEIFKQYFLGTTRNSRSCDIKNIYDVDLKYDDESKILSASSVKPIEIINSSLGYRIIYLLDYFEVNYKTGYCTTSGIPRFENLVPKNNRQQQRWLEERNRAYNGSMTEFMKSLKGNTLELHQYTIFSLTRRVPVGDDHGRRTLVNDSIFYERQIQDTDLIEGDLPVGFYLKIIYSGEHPEVEFLPSLKGNDNEVSYVKFKRHGLQIYDNGYYEDPLLYLIDGYMAWSNKIADLMPREYEPVK